jgi:micrococcal nuclease
MEPEAMKVTRLVRKRFFRLILGALVYGALLFSVLVLSGALDVMAPDPAEGSAAAVVPAVMALVLSAQAPVQGAVPVLSVVDGDTIRVRIPPGKVESVRLIGIDTPESHPNKRADLQARELSLDRQAVLEMGGRAAARMTELVKACGGRVVLVTDVTVRDKYGRILAYVWSPDRKVFLNERMVADGYAMLLTIPPNVRYAKRFREAFRKAVETGAGLWADVSPVLE